VFWGAVSRGLPWVLLAADAETLIEQVFGERLERQHRAGAFDAGNLAQALGHDLVQILELWETQYHYDVPLAGDAVALADVFHGGEALGSFGDGLSGSADQNNGGNHVQSLRRFGVVTWA
jgi:hypothetical protein